MRYPGDHKEKIRRSVARIAARRLRKDGIDGVGVAAVMGEAGLTHGGFYCHFASKEALVREAFDTEIATDFQRMMDGSREGGIREFIRRYLRKGHLDHPENGCPAAALGSEIRRHSPEIRAAFTRQYLRVIAFLVEQLPEPDEATAQALFALLIGTVQLARNSPDRALSAKILKAGETAALALAGC